jgi:hypothetical protein
MTDTTNGFRGPNAVPFQTNPSWSHAVPSGSHNPTFFSVWSEDRVKLSGGENKPGAGRLRSHQGICHLCLKMGEYAKIVMFIGNMGHLILGYFFLTNPNSALNCGSKLRETNKWLWLSCLVDSYLI